MGKCFSCDGSGEVYSAKKGMVLCYRCLGNGRIRFRKKKRMAQAVPSPAPKRWRWSRAAT